MRPTDVCHPIELRAPAPRLFPEPHAYFRTVGIRTEDKAPCSMSGGPDVSRRPRTLRRALIERKISWSMPHGLSARSWAFSSHGANRAVPLTPVSRFRGSSPRLSRLRESCNLTVRPALRRGGTGRRMPEPPRPSSAPPRERRRFVMARVPSAGRDSSQDPVAVTAPVPRPHHARAMVRPLDGDLSPP
jgi:hypothetical protein